MRDPLRFAGENARGFTLIELMIVVAVVAILGAIALPAYQDALRKGNRADAKAILLETAQFMERYFTTNNKYNGGATVLSTVSPKGATGGDIKYNISFETQTATTYVIRAIPANSQTADSCGTLKLSNTGEQIAAKAGCW